MKKRIFAAIDIPEIERRKIERLIERLKSEFPNERIKWEKPEKIHLTLKFLGEIDDEQLKDFVEAVGETVKKVSPFKLQIAKTGVFPAPNKARVLWLGIMDAQGSLRRMNKILETECERRGFAGEKRNFKAHLTIARCKERPNDLLIEQYLNADFPPSPPFEIAEIVIYQSELRPTGSIYSVFSRHEFKEKFKQDTQDEQD